MKSVLQFAKNNPKIKKIIHWLLIPTNEARPRLWVSWFVNPFFHKRKKGSKIRWSTRMDVLPFNEFMLGRNAVIEDFTTINNGVGAVTIGDNTLIGMGNVVIGPVSIGDDVIIAQNVVMSGLNHEYQNINLPILKQPVSTALITIENECWIGANAVITAGITIGKHSVVAAGSIVTKSIPPYSVVAGNPARIIKLYNPESGNWEKP
ncbi:acyltransferase [Pedobacter frigoris]|uniref:Acyltransferase n=1 Tax=Pedobacter frigoris TaxID=2571272 RepID=A0A4U1CTM5_9SPHI|nr:acyltransferase [Pedobacter frigoris]TKC09319.1 acyltransferase [Pedobacter frigoris]